MINLTEIHDLDDFLLCGFTQDTQENPGRGETRGTQAPRDLGVPVETWGQWVQSRTSDTSSEDGGDQW